MDEDFDFFEENIKPKQEEFPNLPVELQGVDCTPDETEKLVGDFPTLKDYITISFLRSQSQELADLLGIPLIDATKKNTYSFEEIMESNKDGLL